MPVTTLGTGQYGHLASIRLEGKTGRGDDSKDDLNYDLTTTARILQCFGRF